MFLKVQDLQKRSTNCRIWVTARMRQAGKPDTDHKIAAPLFTDLKQHRAHSGSQRVRMEARQIGGGDGVQIILNWMG